MGLLQEMMGGAARKVNQDAGTKEKLRRQWQGYRDVSSIIHFRTYDISGFVDRRVRCI
jgi:hypothetical protein